MQLPALALWLILLAGPIGALLGAGIVALINAALTPF